MTKLKGDGTVLTRVKPKVGKEKREQRRRNGGGIANAVKDVAHVARAPAADIARMAGRALLDGLVAKLRDRFAPNAQIRGADLHHALNECMAELCPEPTKA